jgi:two-component system OmpR family sensor kinase
MADAVSPEELENLRRCNAELSEAIAARDSFIAVAAHELRNPITPILGQIELLLALLKTGKCSPEQVERRVDRLHRLMIHYAKRASVLLDVSRITTGKFRLEVEPCDLSALLRAVVESFAETARDAGCPIELDVPAGLSGIWDCLAVEQIVDNLISNAIKYGDRKPVEVSAEDCGHSIRVRVSDHGRGISAEDRARIFQRFERAVAMGARRSGFGVGLWVVGQLVEAMEGTITVDDVRSGGSLFTVTLPRHVEKPSQ